MQGSFNIIELDAVEQDYYGVPLIRLVIQAL